MGKRSKTKNVKSPNKSNKKILKANVETLETLNRLLQALKELDETTDAPVSQSTSSSSEEQGALAELQPSHDTIRQSEISQISQPNENDRLVTSLPLSHYKDDLPNDIKTAYQMLLDGSTLIQSTSTKYTLLGKINPEEGSKLTSEFLQGVQHVCTGVFLLFDVKYGCGRSCRYYAKQAVIGIVMAVIALIQTFGEEKVNGGIATQKTGVVWDACEEIMLKKVPKGNRAAMRRDLFLWSKDCQETILEFQEVLDLGPLVSTSNTNNGKNYDGDSFHGNKNENEIQSNEEQDDSGWDSFCQNEGEDQYTQVEYNIVKPMLSIIQITRGTIQCVLKFCEFIGEQVVTRDLSPLQKHHILFYLSTLHDLTRRIGEGVTDLGALLYPPLDIGTENCELGVQMMVQSRALLDVCEWILDKRSLNVKTNLKGIGEKEEEEVKWDETVEVFISDEVMDFTKKMRKLTNLRITEAEKALSAGLA